MSIVELSWQEAQAVFPKAMVEFCRETRDGMDATTAGEWSPKWSDEQILSKMCGKRNLQFGMRSNEAGSWLVVWQRGSNETEYGEFDEATNKWQLGEATL